MLLSNYYGITIGFVEGQGEPAHFLCNRDSSVFNYTPDLLTMFPSSKFLLMVKDGRAVAHSVVSHNLTDDIFDYSAYNSSLVSWNTELTQMLVYCKKMGEQSRLGSLVLIDTFLFVSA